MNKLSTKIKAFFDPSKSKTFYSEFEYIKDLDERLSRLEGQTKLIITILGINITLTLFAITLIIKVLI